MNVERNNLSVSDSLLVFHAHKSSSDENALNSTLEQNRELKELHFQYCWNISADWFANAKFPSTLRYIDLSRTNIDDRGITNIFRSCRQLVSLHIVGCKSITEKILSSPHFPIQLQSMCVYDTVINPGKVSDILRKICVVREAEANYVNEKFAKIPYTK